MTDDAVTNDAENPYGGVDESPLDLPHTHSVYLYSELPDHCPRCGHEFSKTFFRRLYPRKFRLHTLLFFASLVIITFFVGYAVYLAIPLFAWALTWHKRVKMRCVACGWSKKFIVSVRGFRG